MPFDVVVLDFAVVFRDLFLVFMISALLVTAEIENYMPRSKNVVSKPVSGIANDT